MKNHASIHRHAAAVLLLSSAAVLLTTAPSLRAESFASSASSASSASVGSLSESVQGSSNSSAAPAKVAAGDYRIETVTADAAAPRARLALAPLGAGEAFVLVLPREAVEREGLRAGDVVRASERPYGLAFARAQAGEAFFLALADDWQRELAPRAVPRAAPRG